MKINLHKRNPYISKFLKHSNYSTKIYIYMSYKQAGSAYDPYEKNYNYYNLNPIIIKGYVSQLSPNSLVWKSYGLQEQGALEIVTEKRYKSYFENANKIKINDEEYQIFRESTGNRCIITEEHFQTICVILQKTKAD